MVKQKSQKSVSDMAKQASARTKKALDAAEPVADSLLTSLVQSPYTVPWLLGVAAVIVAVLAWVVW